MWQLFGEDSVNSVDDQWVDGFLEESEKERRKQGSPDEDDLEAEDEAGADSHDEDDLYAEDDEDYEGDDAATNPSDVYERTVAAHRLNQAEDDEDLWEVDALV